MTVLPGSLDYLYYNGIIDHIPYEAYQMGPMTPSGMMQMSGMGFGYNPMMPCTLPMPMMNGTQYLQTAQRGLLYDTYDYPDTFVRRNYNNVQNNDKYSICKKAFCDGEGYGKDADLEVMANGQDGKNFRIAVMDTASKVKETVTNSPNWVKGLLAGGIILTTVACLFKGKKPPVQNNVKPGFWSKLNPVNWFKK